MSDVGLGKDRALMPLGEQGSSTGVQPTGEEGACRLSKKPESITVKGKLRYGAGLLGRKLKV
jgi:hypothetical protein